MPWETEKNFYKFHFTMEFNTFKSKQSVYFSKTNGELAWIVDDNNIAAEI